MPLEHRGIYVSTTLMLVVFTTIGFGGLTEPMLTYTGMRVISQPSGANSPTSPTPSSRTSKDSLDDLQKLADRAIQLSPIVRVNSDGINDFVYLIFFDFFRSFLYSFFCFLLAVFIEYPNLHSRTGKVTYEVRYLSQFDKRLWTKTLLYCFCNCRE